MQYVLSRIVISVNLFQIIGTQRILASVNFTVAGFFIFRTAFMADLAWCKPDLCGETGHRPPHTAFQAFLKFSDMSIFGACY